MFLRATFRFRELKAFVASTKMMASVSEDSNTCRIAWTADSHAELVTGTQLKCRLDVITEDSCNCSTN